MTFRGEDTLVGLIALGVVPWIIWTLQRGLREQRLPIARAYVRRDERPEAFATLFGLYVLAGSLIGFIAFDLLLGLRS